MAKYRKYQMAFNRPTDTDVTGFKVYFKEGSSVKDTDPFVDIGNNTTVVIPDEFPGFPKVDGAVSLGIAAVDDEGNESDMAVITYPFDLLAPASPTGVIIDRKSVV